MLYRLLNIGFIVILSCFELIAQQEMKYPTGENPPEWAILMYSADPDPGSITKAYDLYYKDHDFVKNQHTQYYKRWLRSFSRQEKYDINNNKLLKDYIDHSLQLREARSPTSQWQSMGPWDFDRLAESRSYAPGAAHVYTVKRCVNNASIMYAGTATAGVWKSTDAGQNWSLVTKDLMVNHVFALEIDHSH